MQCDETYHVTWLLAKVGRTLSEVSNLVWRGRGEGQLKYQERPLQLCVWQKVCETSLSSKICHISLKSKRCFINRQLKCFFNEAIPYFSIFFDQILFFFTLFTVRCQRRPWTPRTPRTNLSFVPEFTEKLLNLSFIKRNSSGFPN